MGTLRLSNGTTVTVPDDVTPDYLGQGLTTPGDEAQVTKTKRRRGARKPRVTASKPTSKPDEQPTTPTE